MSAIPVYGAYSYFNSRRKKKNRQERDRRWAEIGQWESQHSINPDTGALEGPGGVVPGEVAMKWQQMHEQAVYNYRQRLMSGAGDYLRGAQGVMQRFRPGGAAALEAGIYGQIGQQQMQQAQMTEPLNLMRDYERIQADKAAKAAKNAAKMQAIASIAGAVGGAAIMAATGGAAAPAVMAANAGAQAMGAANAGNTAGASLGPSESWQPGSGVSAYPQADPYASALSGGAPQGGGYGAQAIMGGEPMSGQQSAAMGEARLGSQPAAGPSYFGPQQGPALSGEPGGIGGMPADGGMKRMQPQGGPQMQQQQSYGQNQLAQGQPSQQRMQAAQPQDPVRAMAGSHYMLQAYVNRYYNDPDWMMIRESIRTEAMARSYGRLA